MQCVLFFAKDKNCDNFEKMKNMSNNNDFEDDIDKCFIVQINEDHNFLNYNQ